MSIVVEHARSTYNVTTACKSMSADYSIGRTHSSRIFFCDFFFVTLFLCPSSIYMYPIACVSATILYCCLLYTSDAADE